METNRDNGMTILFCLSIILVLFILLGTACGTAEFPKSPGLSGVRDSPFVTTFNFGFKTNSLPIASPEGNFFIISAANLFSLSRAANITVAPGTATIGGVVIDKGRGVPLEEVTLEITDKEGNPIGILFYNSLGSVPDFLQTQGTTENGGFTAFNISAKPMGETVFIKAIGGGRGNAQVLVFPDTVSQTIVEVIPVVVPTVGVTGEITEGDGITRPSETIEISAAGVLGDASPEGGLATSFGSGFFRFLIRSEGNFLFKLKGPDDINTYQIINTNRSQITSEAPDITKFLTIVSNEEFEKFFPPGVNRIPGTGIITGIVQDSDGTPRKDASIRVTDLLGQEVGKVFYMDLLGGPDPNLSGTTPNGRYLVLNVPPSEAYLRVTAEENAGGEVSRYSAAIHVPVFPDSVFYIDIPIPVIPPPDPTSPEIPACFTVPVSGRVLQKDLSTGIPFASVSVLGITPVPLTTSNDRGDYFIPSAPVCTDDTPLLASGEFIAKVSGQGFKTTYQEIRTGTGGVPFMNLVAISESDFQAIAASAGIVPDPTKGTIMGMVLENGSGRVGEGVSLRIVDQMGNSVGDVVYFDAIGELNLNLDHISRDGGYMIFNVPIQTGLNSDLAFLHIISEDDTGDGIIRIFPGGVTYADIGVNNAEPPLNSISGFTQNIFNLPGGIEDPIGNVAVSILGEKVSFESDGVGFFNLNLPSRHQLVAVAEKEGFWDTYNFDLETKGTEITKGNISIAPEKLTDPLTNAGGFLEPDKGIITGKAVQNSLAPPIESSFQGDPEDSAVGLFNQDGVFDLAFVDPLSDTVSIFFGNGDGTFRFSQQIGNSGSCMLGDSTCGVETGPTSLGLGDFNGDGLLDLVVLNGGSDSVSILFGSRRGIFVNGGARANFCSPNPTTCLAKDLATGDFDGDGLTDISVSNNASGRVSLFLSNGTVVFTEFNLCDGTTVDANCGDQYIASGDFDNDGFRDIVVSNSNSITVLSNPLGTNPKPPEMISRDSQSITGGMIAGDFNNDRISDLVLIDNGTFNVSVFLRRRKDPDDPNSGFMFDSPLLQPLSDSVNAMTVGDFNGDSNVDLALGFLGSTKLEILPGKGNGTFGFIDEHPKKGSLIGVPEVMTAADFNGDARIDLAVSGNAYLSTLPRINLPIAGIGVTATGESGGEEGVVMYFETDISGNEVINPDRKTTSPNGRFVIFNVPEGTSMVRAGSGGSGNRIITAFPGSVSAADLNVVTFPPLAVPVSGRVVDAVLNPIGEVEISILGTKAKATTTPEIVSPFGTTLSGGEYRTALPANSHFIVKLKK